MFNIACWTFDVQSAAVAKPSRERKISIQSVIWRVRRAGHLMLGRSFVSMAKSAGAALHHKPAKAGAGKSGFLGLPRFDTRGRSVVVATENRRTEIRPGQELSPNSGDEGCPSPPTEWSHCEIN